MNTPYNAPPIPRRKRHGGFPWMLFGCLGGIAAIIFLGIAAYAVVRMTFGGLVDKYTDTEPMVLPQSEMSPEQYAALEERVNAFDAALDAGTAAEPLELTADDINALIANDPKWSDLKGRVHVSINDDMITGDVSLPIDALLPGRYVNGSGSFTIFLRDNMLYVHLDSLTVSGRSLPEEFMQGLRSENLAKDYVREPGVQESLDRFESIEVSDGIVRVAPKVNPNTQA